MQQCVSPLHELPQNKHFGFSCKCEHVIGMHTTARHFSLYVPLLPNKFSVKKKWSGLKPISRYSDDTSAQTDVKILKSNFLPVRQNLLILTETVLGGEMFSVLKKSQRTCRIMYSSLSLVLVYYFFLRGSFAKQANEKHSAVEWFSGEIEHALRVALKTNSLLIP